MANEHGGEAENPAATEDLCDKCGVPLPEPRTEYCNLGAGCCTDCMAECEKAGRCAKFSDTAFWEKIARLKRVVHDRTFT